MSVESIVLEDGKYELRRENYNLSALRHGEPWRDLCGDKMVNAMFDRVKTLEAALVSAADFIESAPVSSGVCCCGSDMTTHESAMDCGHSPVDQWNYSATSKVAEMRKVIAA